MAKRILACMLVVPLCLLTLVCLLAACADQAVSGLVVEVLDVGQSDCILVRTGDTCMLIDAGTATERETVQGALRDRGIGRIDYLVLTHPHEDHYGNARMLIEEFDVREVITSGAAGDELGWRLLSEALADAGIKHRIPEAGDGFSLGEAQCEVIWHVPAEENVNEAGLVLRLTYGKTAFLLMGDMESKGEAAMLSALPRELLRCDVLKVGHHGSRTSTTEAFLAISTPRYAAISCGAGNDYGFPHREVLERLAAADAVVHRTDKDGTLYYHSDGQHVTYGKD